jgi:hypothetical protein
LTKFTKLLTQNGFKGFHLHKKYCFEWISIDSISLFYVDDILFEDFVFWYGHMDLPTCQNIGKEIVSEHEMMECMLLLLMP